MRVDLSLRAFTLAFLLLVAFATSAPAQTPGRNVTLVGLTPQPPECRTAPYCGGLLPDTGLKQQNEPSCALSPDTRHIFCGGNDYRGADRKDGVLGDAWLGAYMSRDGGETWLSRLAPGFKGGGSTSLGYAYGADPAVVAFPGGMLYVFIAGDRGEGAGGGVFAQQWIELNREDGYPFVPALGPPKAVAAGNPDSFKDKPAAMITMLGEGTCRIPYAREDGTTAVRTVPAFQATVAYAIFQRDGASSSASIWIESSSDCGATWKAKPIRLTSGSRVSQGVSLTSMGRTYLATWRTYSVTHEREAIEFSLSQDNGRSWSAPADLTFIEPFDQNGTPTSFRTTALPWSTADGKAFHVFWAERQAETNSLSRIKYASSRDGRHWTEPRYVANVPAGHQIIPAAASANGVTQVAWYDTRNDRAKALGGFIDDFVDEQGLHRHTADVWTAQGIWNGDGLVFSPAVRVSRYRMGVVPGPPGAGNPAGLVQLEENYVNSRIFQQGTRPFLGDYIAVATVTLARDPATKAWVPNVERSRESPSFFVAWADNRNLRGNTAADLVQPTGYSPPTLMAIAPDGDAAPLEPYPACNPAAPLSNTRNQDLFGTILRPGLSIRVASAAKPTGPFTRAFALELTNSTSDSRTYRAHIANQPADRANGAARASFEPPPFGPPAIDRDVTVPARSSAAVTLFLQSTLPAPGVRIDVRDETGAVIASALLNGDPHAPSFTSVEGERHDVMLGQRTTSFLPLTHAAIAHPDFDHYTAAFPRIQTPDFERQDFGRLDVGYRNIENPDLNHPEFRREAQRAGGITEITWPVTLQGNTTSGLNILPLLDGVAPSTMMQVIVRRIDVVPMSQQCRVVSTASNEILVNSVGAAGVRPSGSFVLAPGETVLVTIRLAGAVDPDVIGAGVTAQAPNTDGGVASAADPPPASHVSGDRKRKGY